MWFGSDRIKASQINLGVAEHEAQPCFQYGLLSYPEGSNRIPTVALYSFSKQNLFCYEYTDVV